MGEIWIRVFYGIMIVGMVFCFLLAKRHGKDIRSEANAFAFAFVKLSNYVSPFPPKEGLRVKELEGGAVRPLPLEEQSESIQVICRRAGKQTAVDLFHEMESGVERVEKCVGINRTHRAQFLVPYENAFLMAHTFLVGCENPESIDTMEKKQAFDSFLLEQPKHRMMLLKRISGAKGDEFRKLNRNYAAQMEQMEAEELAARRGKTSVKA